MMLSRSEMLNWSKPDVPGAVMWESEYHWIGLGKRSTVHSPDMIEDVVHSLATPQVVHFSVYPINAMGQRITTAPFPASQPSGK